MDIGATEGLGILNEVTADELENVLKSTRPGKATGPSEISRCMLLNSPRWLIGSLRVAFNVCIKHRTIPNSWRHGYICPIPKPGSYAPHNVDGSSRQNFNACAVKASSITT